MNFIRIIMFLVWVVVLLSGSCFGPRTPAGRLSPTLLLNNRTLDAGLSTWDSSVWTVLSADLKGDGRDASLADAAQFSYRYDKQHDYLWFRVGLYGAPNEQSFGVNIAVDTGAGETIKTAWWGSNNTFKFDKLLTAWVTRGANGYEGTIGVGDKAGVETRQFNNLAQNNLRVQIEGDAILLGVKRTDLTDKLKMNLIAAVGSNQVWNDDVPTIGSSAIDLTIERPTRGLREIDLARNNFELPADQRTQPANKATVVTARGTGSQALILVPGVYSGAHSFDDLIARNRSRYKFYVVNPPGINRTLPRAMPTSSSRFSELTWTRRFEQDLLQLIVDKKLKKPILVAESHPASIAVVELALEHPDKIGGVVVSGTNLLSYFTSPTDSTRKRLATPAERVELVDEAWAAKWFKYVTPETWLSNDMRPEMLLSDPARGQQASDEIEAAQLAVKIRYLCEFWASDVTQNFDKLRVPMLVLIAGFDEKFLNDQANRFTKLSYVDSWQTLVPKNPKVELVKIPDARLLIFQDQPQRAEHALARFIDRISKALE